MSNDTQMRVRSITEGAILPSMIKFAIPLILMGVLQMLYSTADSLVVGIMGGKDSLAAVGATGSIISMCVNFFISMFVGTSILTARYTGSKDDDGLRKVVSTSYVIALVLGIGVTVLGEGLAEYMLTLTECPDDILPYSIKYLRIYFLSVPASMMANFSASVIRSSGDSRTPFIYSSISGVINVALNVILVFVTDRPVESVAIATTVSIYVSAFLFARRMLRARDATRLFPFKPTFDRDVFLKIIRYGIPAAISSASFSISNLIIQPAINSFGSVGLSGMSAAAQVESYIFVISDSVGVTVATFIGQNMGAERRDRVKRSLFTGYGINLSTMAVCTVILITLGKFFLGFFLPGEPAAVEFGYLRLLFVGGAAALNGIMTVNVGALQAYGYNIFQMISNLIGVCAFRVVWMTWVYPLNPTPENFLVCYPLGWLLTAAALLTVVMILTRKYLRGDSLLTSGKA